MDKFFKDKHGKIKVWQAPNLPLMTWAIAAALAMVIKHGSAHRFFDVIAFCAVFTWAYLEIRQGDSKFRRVLGAIVMVASVYSRVN